MPQYVHSAIKAVRLKGYLKQYSNQQLCSRKKEENILLREDRIATQWRNHSWAELPPLLFFQGPPKATWGPISTSVTMVKVRGATYKHQVRILPWFDWSSSVSKINHSKTIIDFDSFSHKIDRSRIPMSVEFVYGDEHTIPFHKALRFLCHESEQFYYSHKAISPPQNSTISVQSSNPPRLKPHFEFWHTHRAFP